MVDQSSGSGSRNGIHRRRGRKSESEQPATNKASPSAGGVGSVKNDKDNNKTSETYYQPHTALLIQWDSSDAEPWYKYGGQSLPDRDAVVAASCSSTAGGDPTKQQPSPYSAPPSLQLVQKYRSLADAVYRREVQLFSQQNNSSSKKDDRWVESTMRQGTLKDRIAAMSVVVSTHPVHKFYALDGLLQMAGCGTSISNDSSVANNKQPNSRVSQLAAEALEDLFLHTFLPSDRKLLTLAQRPLNKYEKHSSIDSNNNNNNNSTEPLNKSNKKKKTQKTLSPRILLLWRFEEMVKEKYDFFLRQYLAHTLHHSALELPKTAALRSTANMLRLVPEGEAILLDMLVNKLGDPGKSVAATAAHELRRTLQQHPAMLPVVAREVQQLAHRPHLSRRALYNCVTFLNQLQLTRESRTAAASSNKNNQRDSSIIKESPSLAASLIRTYFRLFEVAIQSDKNKIGDSSSSTNPKTLVTASDNNSNTSSHSRLLSALLTGVNRAHPYLPAADPALEEHVDALYRIVHTAPPGARTQSLLLLFHLAVGAVSHNNNPDHNNHPHRRQRNDTQEDTSNDDLAKGTDDSRVARRNRFYRALYSTLSQPGMLDGGKHLTMYFNLLYKAIKHDTDTTRQVVFGKRLLATTLHGTAAVAAASLFLVEHVSREHPVLRTCYYDQWDDSQPQRVLDPTKRDPRGALVLLDVTGSSDANDDKQDYSTETKAPGWEVSLLAHHYHPAVPKFVAALGDDPNDSSNNNTQYSGDPLKDFALAPFLDKFAYRNPKSVQRVANKFGRGESVAERRSGTDSVLKQQFAIPVNDPSFLEQGAAAVEDEFFYNFFAERAKRDQEKGIVRYKSDDRKKEVDDDKADELKALEKLEEDIDGRNFADFEAGWETDEDEDAFADSLAEKIIEDAVDAGHGPDDLDDEDPDMDGWDDMSYDDDDSSSKDNDKGTNLDSENESDVGSEVDAATREADDDDFMDRARSSSDDDSDGEPAVGIEENTMFHVDSDDSDSSAIEENPQDEDDSHDEGDLALVDERSSSDDDEAPELVKLPAKVEVSSTFAPAEDYEELITKSWTERKRASSLQQQDEKDGVDTGAAPTKDQAKKSRKRRKQR